MAAVSTLGPVAVWAGRKGRRFGGLAVETCGLKVTLRTGLAGGTGRDALLSEGSRGDDSEAALEDAIVALREAAT